MKRLKFFFLIVFVLFVIIIANTAFLSNIWCTATGRGFIIPKESSYFTFTATKMNQGSGEWWLYGEDENYFYSSENATSDKDYVLLSKERGSKIKDFDKFEVKTWKNN
jgi:hypothetical protein